MRNWDKFRLTTSETETETRDMAPMVWEVENELLYVRKNLCKEDAVTQNARLRSGKVNLTDPGMYSIADQLTQ